MSCVNRRQKPLHHNRIATIAGSGSRICAIVSSAVLATVSLTAPASAGGFAVREQSASSQGASFAGSAAGFDLSSMFWNPAAVTTKNGLNTETHAALIIGQSDLTATGGSLTLVSPYSSHSGNIAEPTVLAASYGNYQFGNFYVGMSLNTPFGLTTKPDRQWKGQALGRTSKLLTVNGAPTVGYKIAPWLSVAAGVQVQYIDAKLSSNLAGLSPVNTLSVKGDDVGYGFTAGLLFEPMLGTKIGIGFRSHVSHTLEGDQHSAVGKSDIKAKVDMPEIATVSLSQQLSNRLTFLGTVEWTNWSRVDTINIDCTSRGGACVQRGQTLNALELNYDDGWFFSAGLEYAAAPQWLLRTGIGYEISPARNDTSRTVRIADNDRIWTSIGATYQYNAFTSIDFAYTHIFVKDGTIKQDAGPLTLVADTDQSVDILAASLKFKW